LTRYLVYAIKLQVHELTDAQAGGSHEQQRISPQPVGPALECTHQTAISIRWNVAR